MLNLAVCEPAGFGKLSEKDKKEAAKKEKEGKKEENQEKVNLN